MAAYSQGIRKLKTKFDGLELNHIPHRLNEAADALAKAASGREPTPIGVFARNQIKPAIHPKETKGENDPPIVPDLGEECKPTSDELADETADVMDIEDGQVPRGMDQDWRTPYVNCLACCILPPPEKTEARRLTQRAKSFALVREELYKRSVMGVLQRCIPVEQGKRLLKDIHGGICDHHAASRSLVGSAFRQGFY